MSYSLVSIDKLVSPTGGLGADGARSVTERVVEVIGLTYDQFIQAVVLPQGRFDALLAATEKERNDILTSILDLGDGVTLVRLGGHFTGGTVLHWAGGADGRGAVLSGDILAVASDRRYMSFMYSFPNYIPLPASEVRRIREAIEPYAFDRIYGAWWGRVVRADAKEAVRRFADRYIKAIAG